MNTPAKIALVALTLGAVALSGHLDHQDAQDQHAYQCQMIRDGHWPASVNPHCKEEAR